MEYEIWIRYVAMCCSVVMVILQDDILLWFAERNVTSHPIPSAVNHFNIVYTFYYTAQCTLSTTTMRLFLGQREQS